jgi:hypothetical protein
MHSFLSHKFDRRAVEAAIDEHLPAAGLFGRNDVPVYNILSNRGNAMDRTDGRRSAHPSDRIGGQVAANDPVLVLQS